MDKALVVVSSGPLFGKTAIGAVGRTALWIMGQQIDAPVDCTTIHSSPDQSERNSRGLAHFCIFGALLFVHFYFTAESANIEYSV